MPVHVYPVTILSGAGSDTRTILRHGYRYVESGLYTVRTIYRISAAARRRRGRPVRLHRRVAGHAAQRSDQRRQTFETLYQLEGLSALLRNAHHGGRFDDVGRLHVATRQASRSARLAATEDHPEELRRSSVPRLHTLLSGVERGGADEAVGRATPPLDATSTAQDAATRAAPKSRHPYH